MSELDDLIRKLPSKAMRDDLSRESPEFATKAIRHFNGASEKAKAEIVAFHEQGGPRLAVQVQLDRVLAHLPVELREALGTLHPEDAFAAATTFLEAGVDDQAGMLEFLNSGGPERLRQLRLEHEEGVPTASSLERAVRGEA